MLVTVTRGSLKRLGEKHNAYKPDFYYSHYESQLHLDPAAVESVLELGIHEGGSLLMWSEYFPNARIFGVDLNAIELPATAERVHTLQSDQTDIEAISRFVRSKGAGAFDLIIDDCSHIGYLTKLSFWPLFNDFLKPGGYYVIEDWQTGYWETWVDGKSVTAPDTALEPTGVFESHRYGIPGFVKQLVDESSAIESILIMAGFVIVKKQSVENLAEITGSVNP